jgi:hypothetical protein
MVEHNDERFLGAGADILADENSTTILWKMPENIAGTL